MTTPVDPDPGPLSPRLLAVVGVGGAVGTALRYGVDRWLPAGSGFPWDTFLVNVAGSLILGVLLQLLSERGPDVGTRQQLRLLLGTGFCGGLTTYSTLAVETDLLFRASRSGLALVYVAATLCAGFLAAAAGIVAARRAA